MNSKPSRVFPLPVTPCTRITFALGIPPNRTASRPRMPVLIKSPLGITSSLSFPNSICFRHCCDQRASAVLPPTSGHRDSRTKRLLVEGSPDAEHPSKLTFFEDVRPEVPPRVR